MTPDEFLCELLANGEPMEAKTIRVTAEAKGFNFRTIQRAQARCGRIVIRKKGLGSTWTLAEVTTPGEETTEAATPEAATPAEVTTGFPTCEAATTRADSRFRLASERLDHDGYVVITSPDFAPLSTVAIVGRSGVTLPRGVVGFTLEELGPLLDQPIPAARESLRVLLSVKEMFPDSIVSGVDFEAEVAA